MKKKIIIAVLIILVIGISISISISICSALYKDKQKNNEQERYVQIKESTKKAVEWNIKAHYPGCSVSKDFKEGNGSGTHYNSSFLINQGYIKKSELLDVDNESYCDVYVDIKTYFQDPLDQQRNCEIYYRIYLKCKNYEDKGYINWG